MSRLIVLMAALLLAIGCKNSRVDQPVEQPTFELETESIELDYCEQRVEIGVTTQLDVDVKVDVLWINVIGVENGKIKLSIKQNSSESAREADVRITAGEHSRTLRVKQLPKPDIFELKLGHRATLLDSPRWGGESLSGSVNWGDGSEPESYAEGVSHEYADEQLRTATFTMEGATSFEIEQVGDIESVEITL
jgi:hypothetical protein